MSLQRKLAGNDEKYIASLEKKQEALSTQLANAFLWAGDNLNTEQYAAFIATVCPNPESSTPDLHNGTPI